MERLLKLQFVVNSVEKDKIQSLIFLLQEFGEPIGYSFDIHHFHVFSASLAGDLEQPSANQISKGYSNPDIEASMTPSLEIAAGMEQLLSTIRNCKTKQLATTAR